MFQKISNPKVVEHKTDYFMLACGMYLRTWQECDSKYSMLF